MTTSHTVPVIDLNDGSRIPQVGFGVFQIPPEQTKAAVLTALEAGYRHIDTAEMYENEAEVGEAVAQSGIAREEIWITSKLSNRFHDPAAVHTEGARSAERLGGYMDLFLIHWPLAMLSDPALTWEAMQELRASGAARSLGVSNFQIHHLEALARAGTPTPSVNQSSCIPTSPNRTLKPTAMSTGSAWRRGRRSLRGRCSKTAPLSRSPSATGAARRR
jgi:2,5-diketo-D-gluconate reductase A